jgi:negative regulator of flagellin synthesis FlgM
MKIDPSIQRIGGMPGNESRPAKVENKPASEAANGGVTLSDLSTQLRALETQLAAIPTIDRARVEEIKQAIASGQYTINPENIADGLIDSATEMLGRIK